MKRLKALSTASILAVLLHGCAWWDSTAISYATIDDDDGIPTNESDPVSGNTPTSKKRRTATREQRVFIWHSDYSAGIGTKNGICAQAATTMRSTSVEAEAKATDALAKVVAGQAVGDPKEAASGILRLNQNSALTNATSVQTSYANISLFYLCQISLNQELEAETIKAMWAKAHEAAVSLSKEATEVAKLLVTQVPSRSTAENEAFEAIGPIANVAAPPSNGMVGNEASNESENKSVSNW